MAQRLYQFNAAYMFGIEQRASDDVCWELR